MEHILLDEDGEINDINFNVFSGCKNLTTLSNVPDSWIEDENITNKIFEQCPNLTLIISESNIQKIRPQYGEILDGVKNISKREYVNGDVLNKLVIPKTVESIEEGTFENCTNLKNVKADPKWLHRLLKWEIERLVVPDWVLEVHEKDFDCCYKLKELVFENDNTKLCGESCDAFENIESMKCSATTASSLRKNAKKNLKKLEIKEGTIEIGEELSDFYNLEKITLPETLRKTKSKGLSYCKNLKYIKIPDGVEIIEKGAFEGSKKIETVFCNLKLLKYLPKNQIKTIRLKDENIDINKVIENDCKGYENLEKIIYNKDGKIVSYDIPKKKEDKKVEDVFENCDELEKDEEPTVVPVPKEGTKIDPQAVPAPSQKAETTTIEQLVQADPANKKYAAYVEKIRKAIESGKYVNENTKDMSLEGISNSIINVCIKIDEKHTRKPYIVQILTILRLADEILNQHGDRKGAVAEVKTGEGKSFIIGVLGIVLALRDIKVDIITSTTELAKRDEEDQRKYYELFKEKIGGELSGVLYHEVGDRGYYDGGTKFENNFNVEVFNRSIVYSTGCNFEFAYLGELYTNRRIRGKREYDVAIVDEVDNMLLDQNSSPALSARGIEKVYAKDILTIVYYCQKYEESEILRTLNIYIPNNGIGIELVRKMKRAAEKAERMNEG